jgi:hypothetical protein
MTERKKPTNSEELEQDISTHPERGKFDGEDVIRFDSVELRGQIPRELYRRFLEVAGVQGMSKGQGLVSAIACWVSQPGNQAMVDNFLALQSERYNLPRVRVRAKMFGAYKKVARLRSKNLQKDNEEE